ncbi:hypothetical protein [Pseudomonas bohemica]|uniref:hypothetical protein n=1 Tax=Pseudomonas bohemica TaxID=2044872 RepID=UPI000DA5FE09|nr:hypothetical protein [Pseudomonas bohemica]
MQIRLIQTLDAAQMIELNRALDTETDFMLMEPGERTTSLEQQVSRINAITASDTETCSLPKMIAIWWGSLLSRRE